MLNNNVTWVEEMPPLLQHQAELPSLDRLLSAVQKCKQYKNLTHAKCVHTYIRDHQLETNVTLGNHLVPMLVECGSVLDAQEVFDKLAERSEHAWTSLIQGYIHQGDLHYGFEVYQKMKDNGVHPSQFTFMALLKAASHRKSIDRGLEIHSEVVKEDFESNLFVGNSLIDMYAKCSHLVEAQEVFDMLLARDVVSWNTLIDGYAEHGLYWEALNCFDTMKLNGVAQTAVTFVCSLKACGSRETKEKGLEIHADIVFQGFDDGRVVKNSLINVYAKLGMVAEAQGVFDKLEMRDNVSWNTLITAYAEKGLFEEVRICIKQMQEEHVSLDPVTFLCSLRACSSMLSITTGFEMHAEIIKEGLEEELFVGNTLMDMYIKCGSFVDAKVIFDELPIRDVISWNIFFMGCIEHGLACEALAGFKQMKTEGVPATASIYLSILKCLSGWWHLDQAQEIHSEIVKRGLEVDPFLCNSVVNVYAKCQSLEEAMAVFDQSQSCDVVTWNTMMVAYIERGLGEEALGCFLRMRSLGILPDCLTFICTLRSCVILGDLITGQEVHAEIVKRELEKDVLTSNTLVDFYAGIGHLVEAQYVFDHLQAKDAITWTALIVGYAEHGLGNEVVYCLEQMQLEGINPDAVTFVSSLKGCGCVGALERGREVHAAVTRAGFELIHSNTESLFSDVGPRIFQTTELNLANALIDMYAKCGSMIDAQKVFDLSPIVDVVAWNSLIAGYARQEEMEIATGLVVCMREEGVRPDELTLRNVLSICSHAGRLDEGQNTFEALVKQLDRPLTIGSINCLIDLFGRAGRVDEAAAVLEQVPLQLDLVTWSSLLAGCRKKGNLRLSRTAFAQAAKLAAGEGTSAFVLMSDICAGCSSVGGLEWSDRELERYQSAAHFGAQPTYSLGGSEPSVILNRDSRGTL